MMTSEVVDRAADADSAAELQRIRVGFVVGPTGAGKTALAINLADELNAEIVNADSRQFYRGMDIGTAKPSLAEQRRVRHHLIDIRTPDDPVDVVGFVTLARAAISDIVARGRRVLVVGGSGLYLRALRGGIFRGPAASVEIRERLAREAREDGVERLHRRLGAVDPAAAARIGHNDLYRIIRALEVYELTGEPISTHQTRHAFSAHDYDCLAVAIAPPREHLYAAIDQRFDAMLQGGLVAEVRALLDSGYAPDRPPLQSIGYRHIVSHLRGELSMTEAVRLAKRDSRRLAKRQLTWFRADPELVWLDGARPSAHALGLFQSFFTIRDVR